MKSACVLTVALLSGMTASAAWAADPPPSPDCPFAGSMPDFAAAQPPERAGWGSEPFRVTEGGVDKEIRPRGAVYSVNYAWPGGKEPNPKVAVLEILENYRAAPRDLHARILRDNPENLTARLDDQGKSIWVLVDRARVVTVEERPFQSTLQPPTADVMKDKLDKEGHIALYINLDFDKATLKPDAQPIIAEVVGLLKRDPDLKLSVEGHTDNIGGHDYNVKLSKERAAAVVAAIAAGGINGASLSAAGYGPDKPVAPDDADDGRAKNRRVELVRPK